MGLLDKLVEEKVGVERAESDKSEVRRILEDGGADIAFEIDSDFDLSAFESTPGGAQESKGLNSESSGAPVAYLGWGQIQTEILDAVINDDDVWDGENLQALAKRLRSTVEDFAAIVEQTDPQLWNKRRLDRLLQREQIRNKDYSWDEVEAAAIGKLHALVQNGKMIKTAEILAIAQAANKATRRVGGGQMPLPGGNVTTINVNGVKDTDIQLPGPGNLGTMRLTLSAKTVNQLSQGITIDAQAEKYTDSIEMLGGDDVPELSKLADES